MIILEKQRRTKTMKKRIVALLMAVAMTFSLAACGGGQEKKAEKKEETKSEKSIDEMSFDEMKESAKGTTVTFYGWGGDEKLNAWLDDTFAAVMKEKYDITMERVPMDIDQVLSQLSGGDAGGRR